MEALAVQARFLGQFPDRRTAQILARAEEAAGQRELPLEWGVVSLDHQHVQPVLAHRQDGEVNGELQQQPRSIRHAASIP